MRTTWILALLALTVAVGLALTACGDNVRADVVHVPEDTAPVVAPPPPATRTAMLSPLDGAIRDGWAVDWSGFVGTSTGCMRATGFGGRFALAVTLDEGDEMIALTFAMIGNGSADVDVTSLAVAPNGDRFLGTVGSLTQPNVPPLWADYTIDLTDTLVTGGVAHWFEVSADQPGACVGLMRLAYVPGA